MIAMRVFGMAAVLVLASAAPAVSAAAVDGAASLVAQADAAPAPVLGWAPCAEAGLERYECATAAVPLDYARPQGATLALAVLRQRAADAGSRIGTLFTAVGGPGASGLDAVKAGGLPGGELARRFDIVTFDQRGIGRSRQVRCFASPAEQERFWTGTALPPANPAQQRLAERNSRALAAGCAQHDGALIRNLTTVDAARDMDLLRRALREDRISYTGGSYASYLGQVYGALFGERVRALHLVAMIDPNGYTNATLALLWQRAAGTEAVFGEFARLCAEAGQARCAFAGPSARDVLARNASLLDRLRRGPITIGTGRDALPVHYSDVLPAHAGLLYDPQQGWPALAALLTALEAGPAGDPRVVREVLGAVVFRFDFLDSLTAISCADHTVPRAPGIWPALAAAFDAHVPHYGRHWLYLAQPCAAWRTPPGGYPQRHTGPWTVRSDTPALLVNNRFDPVTPLAHARQAQRAMGHARLVVVEGHGHHFSGECTQRLRERYLIDLWLPAPGTTCRPDRPPFAG